MLHEARKYHAGIIPDGEESLDTLQLKEFLFIVFKSQQLVTL